MLTGGGIKGQAYRSNNKVGWILTGPCFPQQNVNRSLNKNCRAVFSGYFAVGYNQPVLSNRSFLWFIHKLFQRILFDTDGDI